MIYLAYYLCISKCWADQQNVNYKQILISRTLQYYTNKISTSNQMYDQNTYQQHDTVFEQIVQQHVNNIDSEVYSQTGLKLKEFAIYQIIIRYYMRKYTSYKKELLYSFIKEYNDQLEIMSELQKNSDIQHELRQQSSDSDDTNIKQSSQQHQNMQSLVEKQFSISRQNQKIYTYLIKFNKLTKQCQNECCHQIQQCIDIDMIQNYCYQLSQKNIIAYREKAILLIYETYINGSYKPWLKYFCYQVINHLIKSSNNAFVKEFGVYSVDDLNQFIKMIQRNKVYNEVEFKMRVKIITHMTEGHVDINFGQNFTVSDIQDNVVLNLFNNIENRLLWVTSSSILIIHNIQTHEIIKMQDLEGKKSLVERLLQKQDNTQLYDVIAVSTYKYENLCKLRIRYLNYLCLGNNIELVLGHPKCLLSATLCRVKIQNIAQSNNLKSMYSQYNIYIRDDIIGFSNLKKLYSQNDQYKNIDPFILDLFENNSLDYISIEGGKNITGPFVLTKNINELQFFDAKPTRLGEQYFNQKIDDIYYQFIMKYVCEDSNQQSINFVDKQYILNSLNNELVKQYKIITLSENVFDNLNFKCRFMQILFETNKVSKLQKLAQDICEYERLDFNKEIQQYSWKHYSNYIQQCKKQSLLNCKMKFISQLYDILATNSYNFHTVYNIQTILQQIISIDDVTFRQQFNIKCSDDIRYLSQHLSTAPINGAYKLKYMLTIHKFLIYSHISVNFNVNFSLESIQNKDLAQLFYNIDRKLLRFDSSSKIQSDFIIVHDSTNGKIFKLQRFYGDAHRLGNILCKLRKQSKPIDIILHTAKSYKELGNVRLRYLSYVKLGQCAELTLSYSEVLTTLTLKNVKLTNLSKCINLTNFFTENIVYSKNNIQPLKNLRRWVSKHDIYIDQGESLLQQLFRSNTLEFVFVWNINQLSNIIFSVTLSENVSLLQYLYIYHEMPDLVIKIDSNQVITNLQVFEVVSDEKSLSNQG